MTATDADRPPLVLVDAPDELPQAAAELRASGWNVLDGFELPERTWSVGGLHLVFSATLRTARDVATALQAAARGAGLVVAVADEVLRERLFADLDHLGTVTFRHQRDDPLAALDSDQRRLLELLAGGCTLDDAAHALSYSRRTVNRRLADIRAGLGVQTTAEALAYLRQRLE
jgi:DNA-binding NarL/FixJ family response regulator